MMKHRMLEPGAALTLVVGLVALAGAQAGAQARPAQDRAAKPSAVPRTADGRPDLQGAWDFRTITPLERPDALGGKQRLTDEEAVKWKSKAAADSVDRPPQRAIPARTTSSGSIEEQRSSATGARR